MFVEPIYVQYLLIALASFCAFMVGRLYESKSNEDIIAETITFLIDNGFLRSFTNSDGETEIKKLNE